MNLSIYIIGGAGVGLGAVLTLVLNYFLFKKPAEENKKKEAYRLIGAIEKRAIAEEMRKAALAEFAKKDQTVSQVVPIAIIFGLSLIFAFLLTDGAFINVGDWAPTGLPHLDQWLVGRDIYAFTGNGDVDRLFLVLIRSAVFFLLTGVAPFLAYVTVQSVGKAKLDALVASWGTIIFLIAAYSLGGKGFLLSYLGNLEPLLPVNG